MPSNAFFWKQSKLKKVSSIRNARLYFFLPKKRARELSRSGKFIVGQSEVEKNAKLKIIIQVSLEIIQKAIIRRYWMTSWRRGSCDVCSFCLKLRYVLDIGQHYAVPSSLNKIIPWSFLDISCRLLSCMYKSNMEISFKYIQYRSSWTHWKAYIEENTFLDTTISTHIA